MPKKSKSPQEKKQASLAKDRRNSYGENSKASRKNLPKSKALSERSYRKALRRSLSNDPTDFGVAEPAKAARVRLEGKRKAPDITLAEHLKKQRARRVKTGQRISSPSDAPVQVVARGWKSHQ